MVLNLSKGKLGLEAMPAFGKLLLAMFQGLALRREACQESARVPVHLFLDECHNGSRTCQRNLPLCRPPEARAVAPQAMQDDR